MDLDRPYGIVPQKTLSVGVAHRGITGPAHRALKAGTDIGIALSKCRETRVRFMPLLLSLEAAVADFQRQSNGERVAQSKKETERDREDAKKEAQQP